MAKRPPTIPDSELDVLKVLWDLGQATVREALETLRSAGRQWSYATVATLLDRLESKGLVTSDRRELAFIYKPVISTQEVRQKRVSSLVDKLYQGEPGLLVLHLLKSHPLDATRPRKFAPCWTRWSARRRRRKTSRKGHRQMRGDRFARSGPSSRARPASGGLLTDPKLACRVSIGIRRALPVAGHRKSAPSLTNHWPISQRPSSV